MQQSQAIRLQLRTMHVFLFCFVLTTLPIALPIKSTKEQVLFKKPKSETFNFQPNVTNSPYMCIVFYFHSTSMVVILLRYHDDNMVAQLSLILTWFLVFD